MKKLLDFYADWCQPCKQMSPILDELEKDFQIEKIDIDGNMKTASDMNILSVPTYIVMDGDKEVARFTGVTDKAKLFEALRE